MLLSDDEKRMYAGEQGPAVQKAMDLLVRYGEALGAERLVDTQNVCGANVFTPRQRELGGDSEDAAFSRLSLDSDEIVEMPHVKVFSCQLIGPMDREEWTTQGVSDDVHAEITESMEYNARHGVHLMNTCTPYQVGQRAGEGRALRVDGVVGGVYCNSVLGARTNAEGRESTSAAMLTGKIPDWGFHLDEYRFGTHRIDVEVPVETSMDWGMLGYFIGEAVEEHDAGARRAGHAHAGPAQAQALRRGRRLVRRRRAVPHGRASRRRRRRIEAAFGPNTPAETLHVRRGGAATRSTRR